MIFPTPRWIHELRKIQAHNGPRENVSTDGFVTMKLGNVIIFNRALSRGQRMAIAHDSLERMGIHVPLWRRLHVRLVLMGERVARFVGWTRSSS